VFVIIHLFYFLSNLCFNKYRAGQRHARGAGAQPFTGSNAGRETGVLRVDRGGKAATAEDFFLKHAKIIFSW